MLALTFTTSGLKLFKSFVQKDEVKVIKTERKLLNVPKKTQAK